MTAAARSAVDRCGPTPGFIRGIGTRILKRLGGEDHGLGGFTCNGFRGANFLRHGLQGAQAPCGCLTRAAVDIQLLMRWCPLRACAPVGAPRMFWCEAERD